MSSDSDVALLIDKVSEPVDKILAALQSVKDLRLKHSMNHFAFMRDVGSVLDSASYWSGVCVGYREALAIKVQEVINSRVDRAVRDRLKELGAEEGS